MDPIEASMGDDAVVLHREKLVSRGMAATGFGLGAFTTLAAIAATQSGEIGAAGAVVMGMVALAFVLFGIIASVKRVAVTREDIRVVVGGRSRVVPLANVDSATLYSYRGAPPAAVVVKWRDGDAERAIAIESQDPKALLAAIEGARSRVRLSGAAGVEPREEDAVQEEEAEADEADGNARAR